MLLGPEEAASKGGLHSDVHLRDLQGPPQGGSGGSELDTRCSVNSRLRPSRVS